MWVAGVVAVLTSYDGVNSTLPVPKRMDLGQLVLINLAAICGAMLCAWFVSLVRGNVSDIDSVWGLGFVLVAWISVVSISNRTAIDLLLAALVTIWGLRLAGYLAWRNWGKEEDRRYAEMRTKNPKWFPLTSLATVYGLQGLIMWFVSLPIQVGIASEKSILVLVAIGCLLWAVGLFFEAVGDFQMARFKSDPANRGQVMDRGLWQYTRHPNYFGDCLVWWGIYLAAAAPQSWWWTIVSPLLMTFLLLRVSGVSLLERSLKERVGAYGEYIRRTSSFIPLPPRK